MQIRPQAVTRMSRSWKGYSRVGEALTGGVDLGGAFHGDGLVGPFGWRPGGPPPATSRPPLNIYRSKAFAHGLNYPLPSSSSLRGTSQLSQRGFLPLVLPITPAASMGSAACAWASPNLHPAKGQRAGFDLAATRALSPSR